ncbi:MAG: TonB-dependent receptor [Candidatus Marinimicrobia bacterium]|nr:TonB-dependent receptor [Candidatus Neomarinimicrobiota bacterium]
MKGKIIGLDIKQSFASFGTYSLEGGLSASVNNMGVNARYHYLSSKSDFSYKDNLETLQTRENNDIKRHSFFTAFNYGSSDQADVLKIGLKYQYIGSERGAPGTLSFPNPYARMFDKQHDIRLTLSKKTSDQKHRLITRAYYSNDLNRYLNEHPTEVLFPSDDRYLTKAAGLELQMSSVFLPQLVLNYGVSIRNDIFTNLGIDRTYDRFSYAAYLVSENMFVFPSIIIPKLKITPSIRYNGNNEFKDTWTPKVGLLVNVGPSGKFALKSNYAYNYRIPTFNDLYWPEDAYSGGNPDLLPEYGRDWDIGLRYHLDHVDLSVTFFNQDLTNLIIWESVNWVWTPQNIAKSRIRGLENRLEANILANVLKITANYTYMDAQDLTNGIENATFLPNRARHHANIGLIAGRKNLEFSYSLQYVGKRYTDAANTENMALSSYLLNNMSLGYTCIPGCSSCRVSLRSRIFSMFHTGYYKTFPCREGNCRFTVNTGLHRMR